MRILANYGYKNNGDSYSVTFETTGDVPMTKAPETVDDLFKLAKEAIQRQVEPNGKAPVPGDLPTGDKKETGSNGNGKTKASEKQINYMYNLVKQAKSVSGFHANDYLKKHFNVQALDEIPFDKAKIFIKEIKEEIDQKNR